MGSKPSRAKKQHYVPQLVLKRFCIAATETLWVFDKRRLVSYKSAIRDVASENYFNDVRIGEYDISFEGRLGKVEDFVAPVIEKIVSAESLSNLTAEDQASLIVFIATQMARGKSWRTGMDQTWDLLCEKLGGEENAIRAGVPKQDRELEKFSILNGITRVINDFGPHLATKLWMLQRTRPPNKLLIGDDPVVFDNSQPKPDFLGNLGVACEGIEIYLPLSPNLVLALLCPTIQSLMEISLNCGSTLGAFEAQRFLFSLSSGRPFLLNQQNVIRLNALQVTNAHRFVISDQDHFELALKIIKKNPKYQHPPRLVS